MIWSIFSLLVGHLYVFFGEMSIKIFCPLFDWIFDAWRLAEGPGILQVFRKFLLMDWLNEWMNEWDFIGKIFWVRFSIRRGKRSWEKILSGSQALFPLSKLRDNKAFHFMISENVHLILLLTCEKYWEAFVIHTFWWGNRSWEAQHLLKAVQLLRGEGQVL